MNKNKWIGIISLFVVLLAGVIWFIRPEFIGAESESDDTLVRVGSLKGPTSMGLVHMMSDSDQKKTANHYEFSMYTGADELSAKIIAKEVDIALIPANLASVLYKKTDGQICVIDINTLGVLYLLSSSDEIQSVSDLKGKTIYLTGKGTTPDFGIQYVLTSNGLSLSDVTLEYKSEASEVAAILAEKKDAVGLLPQPFATTAMMKNESLKVVLDLSKCFKESSGADMVTGVTVVSKDFLDQHRGNVKTFLEEQKNSVIAGESDLEKTAELIEQYGIIKKEAALQAYPYCSITCLTGDVMEANLSTYLKVLMDANPSSIGGELPGEEFYEKNLEE